MPYNANDFHIDLDDGRVTVISFGTGKKPLVMIPGLRFSTIDGGAQAVSWYYRIFAREYRIHMIDRKQPPVPGCTIRDLAEDTARIIKKLGISDACVFGASQGGMIAQEIAIEHPELVSKLVLGVTASRVNDTIREAVGGWLDMSASGNYDEIMKDYLIRGYSEAYIKKAKMFIPILLKTQRTMPIDDFVILAKACLTVDTYDRLDKINAPTLVLGGALDKVVSGEASLEIVERLGCESHIYPDLSHEAYNEAKDFNKRIYDFFK